MSERDTIVALASAPGRSALAVLRLSGSLSHSIFKHSIQEKNRFENAKERELRIYTLLKNGNFVDEITAIRYCSPRSFTGEDMVEILCHGGQEIVRQVVDCFLFHGAVNAEKGEFTRRAFKNGKLDLMKAESINALIDSSTGIELSSARKEYKGEYRGILERLTEDLQQLLSDIETEIEFSDEHDIPDVKTTINCKIKKIENELIIEIEKRNKIEYFKEGVDVIIAGPPNAGKSSLFNYMLQQQRSIIHPTPGTTRDIVSEKIRIGDIDIRLSDTAGIRDTDDEIERIGIIKSREELAGAQLIIWITSADESLYETEREILSTYKDCICIMNKIDLHEDLDKKRYFSDNKIFIQRVSVKNGIHLDTISKAIEDRLKEAIVLDSPGFIINSRQKEIAVQITGMLSKAGEESKEEIKAFHIKNALEQLKEISGAVHSEEILNRIFSRFCIGK